MKSTRGGRFSAAFVQALVYGDGLRPARKTGKRYTCAKTPNLPRRYNTVFGPAPVIEEER